MSNRTQLIKIIHVAKRALALDDDTYRLMLSNTTSKDSCSKMSIKELESVLAEFESRGFKRKPFKKRLSPKSGKPKFAEIDKIRAIWITMAKQGFVRDSSETALDAYVRRMTNKGNREGVDHVAWCSSAQAYLVLESLKSWHRRVMIDAIQEQAWTVPMNKRTDKPAGYEAINNFYELKTKPQKK